MRRGLALVALCVGCGGDDGPAISATGLDTRPDNPTCRAPARPPIVSGGDITLQPAFPNMLFGSNGPAIGMMRSRFGASGPVRTFVVDRLGVIWTFVDPRASKDGLAADGTTPVEKAEVFLDIPENVYGAGGEGGLLGAALDPEFGLRDDANYVYVHYTTYPTNKVVRFRIGRSGNAWTILETTPIFQTGSGGGNHWGGDLKFGPDGYLYISLGDGGNGYTAADAQKLSWLRGKILRIDPRGQAGYVIPPGNPYRLSDPLDLQSTPNPPCGGLDRPTLEARTAACPEIFASGFRNPWRMSFDRETQRLWVGDVGTAKEEIDLVVSGKNYGWTVCDGISPTATCPPTNTTSPYIAPIAQFRQGSSVSVTGGYVYRGTALGTALYGAYIFSEVYAGPIQIIDKPYEYVTQTGAFAVTNTYEHPAQTGSGVASLPRFRVVPSLSAPMLVSFAEDEAGELYAITFSDVKGQAIFKLVSSNGAPTDTIPMLLSETGCVDPNDVTRPSGGLVPYDLNAPFWSDGAEKTRYLAIPDGTTIKVGADGDWDFPNQSVLVKHFRVGGKLIETRLLVRHDDGGWAGYTYVWRDDQSDAERVPIEGESRVWGQDVWNYPSRSGCLACHGTKAGSSLGLETRQLNRVLHYESTDRNANQLDTLQHIGMFEAPMPRASELDAFVDPFGTAGDLATRARTYLHTNCGQCHRGDDTPNLHFDAGADHRLCGTMPLFVPGSPETSRLTLLLRDPDPTTRMPKGGGAKIDEAGVTLIEDWVRASEACP
ncbi:MAG: PQQ-dependent sugar dehydrogenase [Myxococcales bacterium]|nr:PQQ-dependent sugar dehydrogenase [Myxococcales bacterium]